MPQSHPIPLPIHENNDTDWVIVRVARAKYCFVRFVDDVVIYNKIYPTSHKNIILCMVHCHRIIRAISLCLFSIVCSMLYLLVSSYVRAHAFVFVRSTDWVTVSVFTSTSNRVDAVFYCCCFFFVF